MRQNLGFPTCRGFDFSASFFHAHRAKLALAEEIKLGWFRVRDSRGEREAVATKAIVMRGKWRPSPIRWRWNSRLRRLRRPPSPASLESKWARIKANSHHAHVALGQMGYAQPTHSFRFGHLDESSVRIPNTIRYAKTVESSDFIDGGHKHNEKKLQSRRMDGGGRGRNAFVCRVCRASICYDNAASFSEKIA